MVGMEGVEPPRLTALEPKSSVSASSTTSPADCLFYMTKARIKPKIAKITHIIVSFWFPFLNAMYERTQKIIGDSIKKALPTSKPAGIKHTIRNILKKVSFRMLFIGFFLCKY